MPIQVVNRNAKNTLARLLAGENLEVQHVAQAATASFNMESRVLTLPVWVDMPHDLIDMLIGHEVGHALFTPPGIEPLFTAVDRVAAKFDPAETGPWYGLAKDILNVIEDVRIERMIQAKYPGLIRNFRLAYDHLVREDFFGVGGRDPNTMNFLDRLNIHYKAESRLPVTFSAEEAPFVDLIDRAKTWDDVVAAAETLAEYLAKTVEQPKPQDSEPQAGSDASQAGSSETSGDESSETSSDESSETSSDEAEGAGSGEGDESGDEAEGTGSGEGEESGAGTDSDDDGDTAESDQIDGAAASGEKGGRAHPDSENLRATTVESMESALRDKTEARADPNREVFAGTLPRPRLDRIVVDFRQILPTT